MLRNWESKIDHPSHLATSSTFLSAQFEWLQSHTGALGRLSAVLQKEGVRKREVLQGLMKSEGLEKWVHGMACADEMLRQSKVVVKNGLTKKFSDGFELLHKILCGDDLFIYYTYTTIL
jgi:hypothetical protein